MDRIRAMKTFVRIAEAGSLTKAAEQLGTSRAIVSTQLGQLETHLGARLLNRTTRHVALTEIGEEYLTFCKRLLTDIDQEECFIAQLQAEPRGALKISAPINFGNLLLAPVVAEFIARHPKIQITVVLNDQTVAPAGLIEAGFDLAVHLGPVDDMSLVSRELGDIRYLACASPDYLQRRGRPASPQDLRGHDCLLHRKTEPDAVWRFRKDGSDHVIKLAGPLLANSVMVLAAGVRTGLGIALLPQYCVVEDLAAGRIVEVLPGYQVPRRPIHVLFAHSSYLPWKTRAFLQFLSERLVESKIARQPLELRTAQA